MANIFRALIMGPPGSGKGTISARIVRDFKFSYVSSGDALREEILKNTNYGAIAKQFIDKGELVPDDLVSKLVFERLKKCDKHNWLVDGFPRTIEQADDLDAKFSISFAINLVVPDEVITSRLKGRWLHPGSGRIYNIDFNPPKVFGKDDVTGETLVQRDDDKPHVVLARLKHYHDKNSPLLDYYRKKKILKEFKGTETNEIWPKIKEYLISELKKDSII